MRNIDLEVVDVYEPFEVYCDYVSGAEEFENVDTDYFTLSVTR